jgi:hypothetical protein
LISSRSISVITLNCTVIAAEALLNPARRPCFGQPAAGSSAHQMVMSWRAHDRQHKLADNQQTSENR